MHAISAQPLHQQMPGGVKAQIVQPFAACVVAQQLRRKGVRQPSQLQRFAAAELLSDRGQQIQIPRGAIARHGFTQGRIGKKQVAVAEGKRLIENGMGARHNGISIRKPRLRPGRASGLSCSSLIMQKPVEDARDGVSFRGVGHAPKN